MGVFIANQFGIGKEIGLGRGEGFLELEKLSLDFGQEDISKDFCKMVVV